MKRIAFALALAAALGGCGIFKGGGSNHPRTALLGDRIPVLSSETGAEIDPALATVPVDVPVAAINTEWAQPGGNAAKSMGQLALGQALARAWTVSIPGSNPRARLAAGPVVADGKLFVVDTEGDVRAYNSQSGAPLWSTRMTSQSRDGRQSVFGGGVSYDNGKVYATNGIGDVAALDAANGSQIWKKRPGGPLRGAPTVANGHVYVVSQDNRLIALKQDDGTVVWDEAATLELAGIFGAGAPAAAQGTVVAGFSSGELNAYRYENGRGVWQDALSRSTATTQVATLSDIDAAPVIDSGRVYAVGQGGRMVALEIVTGQRLWELNIAGISTPWLAGEWIFVVTDDAKLYCIARANGHVRWVTELPRWKKERKREGPIGWTGPVLAGGRLILASTEGNFANVNVADGTLLSTGKAGGPVLLSPVVANETLYILDDKGKLSAWR